MRLLCLGSRDFDNASLARWEESVIAPIAACMAEKERGSDKVKRDFMNICQGSELQSGVLFAATSAHSALGAMQIYSESVQIAPVS